MHLSKCQIAIPLSIFALSCASASGGEDQYKKDLQLAQAKVERQQAQAAGAASGSNALSSGALQLFFGRYYKVGDAWEVVAFRTVDAIATPFAHPESEGATPGPSVGKAGYFHYEVMQVTNGASPEVQISVKQVAKAGYAPVDPRVDEILLKMSDRMVQTQKAYRMHGVAQPIKVSAEGIHSGISPLETYPLDVPEPATALRAKATALPELPTKISDAAGTLGWNPSLGSSYRLDQDDFFGRPVKMLWQQGDPWPAYLRTSNGVALLIGKSTS